MRAQARPAAGLALLAAAAWGLPVPAAAQGLAGAVRSVDDGRVAVRYPVRDDVEVCEHSVRMGDGTSWGHLHRGEPEVCSRGTAELVLEVRDGRVRDADVRAPGTGAPADRDLGEAPAPEVVDVLLDAARRDGVEEALPPAVLARGVETWPRLLETARDRRVEDDVRRAALFWVSRAAAEVVTAELGAVARDDDEDRDIRDAAIFALSRRPRDEGVPILMDVARTAPDADSRRSALFWLARSDDPRVAPFFEEILLRRGPGG